MARRPLLITVLVAVAIAIASPAAGQAANCDPAYPDVCIPSGPDLNCPEVPYQNFTVLPPDPHDLDRGGVPGVGCESDAPTKPSVQATGPIGRDPTRGAATTTTTTTTATTAQGTNPCSIYSSQARAQAAFNADPAGLAQLDSDGDGRACEILGVRAASTTRRTMPSTGAPALVYALTGVTLLEAGGALRLLKAHIERPLPRRPRRRRAKPERWETR